MSITLRPKDKISIKYNYHGHQLKFCSHDYSYIYSVNSRFIHSQMPPLPSELPLKSGRLSTLHIPPLRLRLWNSLLSRSCLQNGRRYHPPHPTINHLTFYKCDFTTFWNVRCALRPWSLGFWTAAMVTWYASTADRICTGATYARSDMRTSPVL
jgi:hypothetical protein